MREGEQSAIYLNTALTGALATGPAIVEQSEPGQSCRQMLTKQREELKEVLVRHQNAFARPVRAYHEFDGLESLTPRGNKRHHYPSVPRSDDHAPEPYLACLP